MLPLLLRRLEVAYGAFEPAAATGIAESDDLSPILRQRIPCTGLPAFGQVSLMQSAMSKAAVGPAVSSLSLLKTSWSPFQGRFEVRSPTPNISVPHTDQSAELTYIW